LIIFKVSPVRRFLSLVSLETTELGKRAKASLVGANTVKASPEINHMKTISGSA
jgi:hypothetical protein